MIFERKMTISKTSGIVHWSTYHHDDKAVSSQLDIMLTLPIQANSSKQTIFVKKKLNIYLQVL